jgi:hypothetical protein
MTNSIATMRELKITKTESELSIEMFDNKLVATIARQFAVSENELDELYNFGILKFEEYKKSLSEDNFNRFSAWNIQQDIIKKKSEISTI